MPAVTIYVAVDFVRDEVPDVACHTFAEAYSLAPARAARPDLFVSLKFTSSSFSSSFFLPCHA